MNSAYQSLRDHLPERSTPGVDAFQTDPRRVKAWIDALPRANQQATLQLLTAALQSLRGSRLDGVVRLGALEALRPVVLDAIAHLGQQVQGSSFPLPPAKEKIAEQVLWFQRELALGYRTAVVEACAPAGSVPFMRGGQVTLALARALTHASRQLAESYALYRTPEPGAWLALHGLFRFAQGAGLADKAIDDAVERVALTPRRLYAHALLLALSNPYRFTQREQQELWPVTRDLGALLSVEAQRSGDGALAVPVDEDRGPGYLPEERVSDGQALLWIDLAGLRRLLDDALVGNVDGMLHIRLGRGHTLVATGDLLRRLRQSWGQASDRGHQRLGAGHTLDSVIGLSGLHYYLAGRLDFDSFMREVRGVGAMNDERVAWAHAGSGASRIPTARARVLDQSLGGYRLVWDRAEAVRARVGELVGLTAALGDGETDREQRHWMVGVIRWLRYDPQGGVDAGIELIARRAHAVGLRSIDRAGVHRAPLRGIQIEHLRTNGTDALHFLAPSVLDPQIERLEVARAADPERFDDVLAQISECGAPQILENAGDYVLLAARATDCA